jgi:nitronate monooxygenase
LNTLSFENTYSTLKNLTDELSRTLPFNGLKEQLRQFHLPRFEWPSLKIGNLTASVPIVQGGMGVGISLSGLASAVAEAGGIGIIAANAIGMIEPDYFKDGRAANLRALRREIRTARKQTKGILGVNIMVAVNDFHEMMDAAIEEKIDLIVMGAGLPIKDLPVEKMRENGVKAIPIVSSVRAAELIFKMWKKIYNDVPDAVVFEGPLAGGHIGFSEEQLDDPAYQLEAIVPGIVEALKPFEEEFKRNIPVIAGGGIYSGEDIHAALKLGASAVQMGTRFVATEECDADDKFKQAYVDSTIDQIGLIKSPVGMPGRAIRNDFIAASEAGERPSFKCAWKCLSTCKADEAKYCISIALNNARRGKINQGFVFAGSNAYRVTEIVPVSSLVGELAEGYQQKASSSVVRHLDKLVARVQDLRGQYDGLGIRVRELGLAYEKSLSIRIQEARDSGVEQLRKQYDSTLGRLKGLQFQIMEGLADSWALLSAEKVTS